MKKLNSANFEDVDFSQITNLIHKSRQNVLQKVNEELILLYFQIGKILSEKSSEYSRGDKYISGLAEYIKNVHPDLKGFDKRGLYRMKQFYEAYSDSFLNLNQDEDNASPLVTQISWTNHLLILSKTKTKEERNFYLKLAAEEHYSKRELERQIESAYYERHSLSENSFTSDSDQVKKLFLDSYVLEFLNLPVKYSEKDFQKSILGHLKSFILEIGKDFSFIGEEFRINANGRDYFIDLLFYHRSLECLVAFEFKVGEFKPEYLSKMNYYLEILDRGHRKESENLSVGVILCASKNKGVVEYALQRSLSPTLVSEYQLNLPDKALLQNKLNEFSKLAEQERFFFEI